MNTSNRISLGLDFGTESVRALLVDLAGRERGAAVARYRHGQILARLPTGGRALPPQFALQHPGDWLAAAGTAVRRARKAGGVAAAEVVGIGVDFTSCTMLPALADGTPLCLLPRFAKNPYAWPKLWKHHGAQAAADRINAVARERGEDWLARYGGVVGLEWFFPKILETLERAPEVYGATEVWVEGGDWLVWRLVGGEAAELPRSTCQAGYKAMWNRADGYPSRAFFGAVHADFADVVGTRMPGRLLAPGECAGELTPAAARTLGLAAGTPVSAAIIDAHAGVPGAGVAGTDTLVMVLGTSSCHMIQAAEERRIAGIAGVVHGGILPGLYGYETGQAAVGDAFEWLRRLAGERDFRRLNARAAALPAGAQGVAAMDWMNGCRTPLMDGDLGGAFTGLHLHHGPEHLFRALIEASGFGLRWIVELLREGGIPVERLVATGGLPHHAPLVVQIYADVLGSPIRVPGSRQGPALGAAVLGAVAAGRRATGFGTAAAAVRAMTAPAGRGCRVVRPHGANTRIYDGLYAGYRRLAGALAGRDLRR
ncbi:MAG: ribulokinase [Planctomycetota bacterium]